MGKGGLVQIPTKDRAGRNRGYRKIHNSVNYELLKKIAQSTNGAHFQAISLTSLQEIMKKIDRLETSKLKSSQSFSFSEEFARYLVWAIVLYATGVLLSWTIFYKNP